MTKMIARKAHNARNGHHFSLRVVGDTDNTIEFARLRMEAGGWNVWADDRDFERTLMHFICQAGRKSDLQIALAAVRQGYNDWYGLAPAYEAVEPLEAMFDATGPGQDWDCNGTQH